MAGTAIRSQMSPANKRASGGIIPAGRSLLRKASACTGEENDPHKLDDAAAAVDFAGPTALLHAAFDCEAFPLPRLAEPFSQAPALRVVEHRAVQPVDVCSHQTRDHPPGVTRSLQGLGLSTCVFN